MKNRLNTISVSSTLLSCLLIVGCSSGSSSSSDADDVNINTVGSSAGNTQTVSGNSSPATNVASGPLSGPRLFQTGDTAVQGTQDNVALGFNIIPSWNYTADTDTNTVTDGLPSNGTPDIIYDEQGRGIEVQITPSSAPFLVTYNADDSIDTITRTRESGEITLIQFNYEEGNLISKITTKENDGVVEPDAEAFYTYSADGRIVSGTYETFRGIFSDSDTYDFETDSSGRVTAVEVTDSFGDTKRHDLSYDASGNITDQNTSVAGTATVDYTFTYSGSAEPTVNLPGFLAATNNAFIPESSFDLFF